MLDKLEKELRARKAAHLQALESNPFDTEDIAMFEMFEREGFTPEQQRSYIAAQVNQGVDAAE